LAVLDQNSKVKSERIKELRAQIFYRLERYEESYNLYRDIVKNSSDEFEQERLTNLQASAVNVENSDIFEVMAFSNEIRVFIKTICKKNRKKNFTKKKFQKKVPENFLLKFFSNFFWLSWMPKTFFFNFTENFLNFFFCEIKNLFFGRLFNFYLYRKISKIIKNPEIIIMYKKLNYKHYFT
jgi:DNA gyrase/topoisomerase IV subunit A